MIIKIISGGETGVDRGALDFAIKNGIAHGGWCPQGRLSESGPISSKYNLIELPSSSFKASTSTNVHRSDGTLIITRGAPSGGTGLTVDICNGSEKPKYVIDLKHALHPEEFVEWALSKNILILNVAGPRESKQSGIRKHTIKTMTVLWRHLIPAEQANAVIQGGKR